MKARILVVEDDSTARLLLSDMLRYAGYTVTQAPDGETALDILEKETFDVVLSDIVMEDVDGIEVLHTARLQPYRPAVILLTGHGTLQTCMSALRAGATDYLLKPCSDEALLTCIERALQRHQDEQRLLEAADLITNLYRPATDDVSKRAERGVQGESSTGRARMGQMLRIGNLVIGRSRQDVWLNGQRVHVTPIEYALLHCLAQTPATVRRFSEIVRHTHELEVNDAEAQALLKVHVSNLRKKLSSAYLVNDRGTGYMLVDPEVWTRNQEPGTGNRELSEG